VAWDAALEDPERAAALAAVRAALAKRPGWQLPDAPVLYSRWSHGYFAIAFDAQSVYCWELAKGDTPTEALAALARQLARP